MLQSTAPETALDKEIALKYIRFLLEGDRKDSPQSRKDFCDDASVHPKLLYYNPHISSVSSLFAAESNYERLANMSLRDWILYHHHYIHQAYRYGAEGMQQTWLGHRLLKSPFDCWIYQELIYRVRPDVILELGVMFGGASRYFADILQLIGHGEVLGVDISLGKVALDNNERISYIEGDSTSPETFAQVKERIEGKRVIVVADSDHEKNHVLKELRLYAQFVPVGSYYIVEDSLNDVMHWHPVPNEGPQAAVREFVKDNDSFVPDLRYAEKYILTLNPQGYLLRVR
ncbi:MAG: CmcI family methyltransferase [Acidobacteriota bacterium]